MKRVSQLARAGSGGHPWSGVYSLNSYEPWSKLAIMNHYQELVWDDHGVSRYIYIYVYIHIYRYICIFVFINRYIYICEYI